MGGRRKKSKSRPASSSSSSSSSWSELDEEWSPGNPVEELAALLPPYPPISSPEIQHSQSSETQGEKGGERRGGE